MAHRDLRQAPDLLMRAVHHFLALLRSETALVKEELKQNAARAGAGVGFLAVAMLLALVALNVLAAAVVAWIAATGLSFGFASLIVGCTLLTVALFLAMAGKSRLQADALLPSMTIRNVKKDVSSIKEAADDTY